MTLDLGSRVDDAMIMCLTCCCCQILRPQTLQEAGYQLAERQDTLDGDTCAPAPALEPEMRGLEAPESVAEGSNAAAVPEVTGPATEDAAV